ncbi:MAG: hypothetical protein V1703_00025 [Candidatus Altiarchaeota archaeon]
MTYKSDEILSVLKDFKSEYAEISASMVAKKGLEGVIMFPDSFKNDVGEIWEPLGKTIDEVLCIISENGVFNLNRLYFEMLGFGVLFYVLSNSDTALVVFIKCRDKLDIFDFISKNHRSICSARDRIIKIIDRQ